MSQDDGGRKPLPALPPVEPEARLVLRGLLLALVGGTGLKRVAGFVPFSFGSCCELPSAAQEVSPLLSVAAVTGRTLRLPPPSLPALDADRFGSRRPAASLAVAGLAVRGRCGGAGASRLAGRAVVGLSRVEGGEGVSGWVGMK